MRYEVGLCIETGHIVWLHGPVPCGPYKDLRIFRTRLRHELLYGEKVIGGRGYQDVSFITPFSEDIECRRMTAVIRARHETVNRRRKQFKILQNMFRHDPSLHGTVLFAVANITQAILALSDPLFSLE